MNITAIINILILILIYVPNIVSQEQMRGTKISYVAKPNKGGKTDFSNVSMTDFLNLEDECNGKKMIKFPYYILKSTDFPAVFMDKTEVISDGKGRACYRGELQCDGLDPTSIEITAGTQKVYCDNTGNFYGDISTPLPPFVVKVGEPNLVVCKGTLPADKLPLTPGHVIFFTNAMGSSYTIDDGKGKLFEDRNVVDNSKNNFINYNTGEFEINYRFPTSAPLYVGNCASINDFGDGVTYDFISIGIHLYSGAGGASVFDEIYPVFIPGITKIIADDMEIMDDGNGRLIGDVDPSGTNKIYYEIRPKGWPNHYPMYTATFAHAVPNGEPVYIHFAPNKIDLNTGRFDLIFKNQINPGTNITIIYKYKSIGDFSTSEKNCIDKAANFWNNAGAGIWLYNGGDWSTYYDPGILPGMVEETNGYLMFNGIAKVQNPIVFNGTPVFPLQDKLYLMGITVNLRRDASTIKLCDDVLNPDCTKKGEKGKTIQIWQILLNFAKTHSLAKPIEICTNPNDTNEADNCYPLGATEKFSLTTLIAHELGHAIGLNHDQNNYNTRELSGYNLVNISDPLDCFFGKMHHSIPYDINGKSVQKYGGSPPDGSGIGYGGNYYHKKLNSTIYERRWISPVKIFTEFSPSVSLNGWTWGLPHPNYDPSSFNDDEAYYWHLNMMSTPSPEDGEGYPVNPNIRSYLVFGKLDYLNGCGCGAADDKHTESPSFKQLFDVYNWFPSITK